MRYAYTDKTSIVSQAGLIKSYHIYEFLYKSGIIIISLFCFMFFFLMPHPVLAYTTNMSASVVIGQDDFVSSATGTSTTRIKIAESVATDGKHLFIADSSNARILIYNSFSPTNGAAADVVIGQTNFTNSSSNQGGSANANTLGTWLRGMVVYNGKLIVGDSLPNQRVLIYNSIPTANNASADVVIGQTNFTSTSGGTSQTKINRPNGLAVEQSTGKLAIAEKNNRRVIIYNSIPTTNGAPADVVVGQSSFTAGVNSVTQSTIKAPAEVAFCNGKFAVADYEANRVLIWNSVPITNGQPADVVIGQTNFTSSAANQGGSVAANTLNFPWGLICDAKGRLFINDFSNNRILIYNSIPTTNNASADIVLGQPDFASSSSRQGSNIPSANNLANGGRMTAWGNYLISADGGPRVLFFEDIIKTPGFDLYNPPEGRDNGITRLKGKVTVDGLYNVSTVEFAVNGAWMGGAVPQDGSFNSGSEEFYFDFDPKANQPSSAEGYTVQVRSTNSNTDKGDSLFYFSPFNLNEPLNNAGIASSYPVFDFSVNKQKGELQGSLAKYQIWIKKGGDNSASPWEILIDSIPIDGVLDISGKTNFENNLLRTDYFDDSSRIKVYSKQTPLTAGTYSWKVTAVDKAGHLQETDTRILKISSVLDSNASIASLNPNFPLAVLNISSVGNPYLSTTNLAEAKSSYVTSVTGPVFYGIAYTNAKVTLSLTEQNCPLTSSGSNCAKTYSTIANQDSRFGINVPEGDLKYGKKYKANMSVSYIQDYNELPEFILSIGKTSSVLGISADKISDKVQDKILAPVVTPSPLPISIPKPQNKTENKKCLWFICF